jgi:hypothetical protein
MDTDELKYIKRTLKHIRRVQDHMLFLIEYKSKELELTPNEQYQLFQNAMNHDATKWNGLQFNEYVKHFIKAIDNPRFQLAWKDHYTKENHHYQDGQVFNKLEMIEVVCDLQSMADEFGEGSCLVYFQNKWVKEWSQWGNDNQGTNLSLCLADDHFYFTSKFFMEKVIELLKENIK